MVLMLLYVKGGSPRHPGDPLVRYRWWRREVGAIGTITFHFATIDMNLIVCTACPCYYMGLT